MTPDDAQLMADKIRSIAPLKDLAKKEINHGQVFDAGLTQVKPGTITVGYVGPDLDSKIDKLIGQLKLL